MKGVCRVCGTFGNLLASRTICVGCYDSKSKRQEEKRTCKSCGKKRAGLQSTLARRCNMGKLVWEIETINRLGNRMQAIRNGDRLICLDDRYYNGFDWSNCFELEGGKEWGAVIAEGLTVTPIYSDFTRACGDDNCDGQCGDGCVPSEIIDYSVE